MDGSRVPSHARPAELPHADTVRKVLRGVGFALLGSAIAIDVFGPVVVRWRRAAAARAVGWVDQVAPTEHFLLDAAIELLRASEPRRS